MECPRCGGPLETLELDGARAVVCERCGYADTPADHSPGERPREESWEEVLRAYGAE